ncbi:biotin transporter BioY [Roseibium aestuarii]|uniref:Biotin transporter n=1 Tax=Roseibium aestuarii TaxID=2600299 RepID=A0ABW4JZW6_9HYPH|nr:biotin transporter BioY [Roseibium aestuarii]
MTEHNSGQAKDRALVQIALYAAVIAALGFMPPVHIPFLGGTPITAQSLGVMLAGVMLGSLRGGLAVVLFLAVVAIGAPLLAGGRGGLAVFQSPWAGYLFGWPVAAFVAGLTMRATRSLPVFPAAFASAVLGGIVVLYAIGVTWFSVLSEKAFLETLAASTIFLPGDLLKAAVVAAVAQTVARGLPRALASRA